MHRQTLLRRFCNQYHYMFKDDESENMPNTGIDASCVFQFLHDPPTAALFHSPVFLPVNDLCLWAYDLRPACRADIYLPVARHEFVFPAIVHRLSCCASYCSPICRQSSCSPGSIWKLLKRPAVFKTSLMPNDAALRQSQPQTCPGIVPHPVHWRLAVARPSSLQWWKLRKVNRRLFHRCAFVPQRHRAIRR
jgi:hypothetical protein